MKYVYPAIFTEEQDGIFLILKTAIHREKPLHMLLKWHQMS